MEKTTKINFAFNLFLTYLFFLPIFSMWGWKSSVGFSIGFICAELSWFTMNEDFKKITKGNFRLISFGFIKRYAIFSIALLISFSSLSVEGFFSTFIGLEILTLTLFTSSALFCDFNSEGGAR